MTIPTILALILIIGTAFLIQSMVGFASALFATPLLLWIGLPLPQAIVIVAFSSMFQSLLGARYLRRDVPWKPVLGALGLRTVFIFAGIELLKHLAGFPRSRMRLVVGIIMIIITLVQIFARTGHRDRLAAGWAWLAFSASGFLSGLVGMGGPPLVLWALAHNWTVEKTRGFLFTAFVVSMPVHLGLMYNGFGSRVLSDALIAVYLLPAVAAGSFIGLPLGNRIPKPVLKRIVYGILLAIGANSVIQAFI